jgi:hypothetical protein
MARAIVSPEPKKGGRGKKKVLESKGFSDAYLSQARTILRWSRGWGRVRAGLRLALADREGGSGG